MCRSVGMICGRCSTRCAGLCALVHCGDCCRMICQPWLVVYQQFRRWDEAGCFEAMVNDMRSVSGSATVAGAAGCTWPSTRWGS